MSMNIILQQAIPGEVRNASNQPPHPSSWKVVALKKGQWPLTDQAMKEAIEMKWSIFLTCVFT